MTEKATGSPLRKRVIQPWRKALCTFSVSCSPLIGDILSVLPAVKPQTVVTGVSVASPGGHAAVSRGPPVQAWLIDGPAPHLDSQQLLRQHMKYILGPMGAFKKVII